jgi:hypothetical protein
MFSSFANSTSVNEVPDRGNPLLGAPAAGPGSFSEEEWRNQSYPAGFPPLPEGNNSDALAPLNSRPNNNYQFDSGTNFSQAASSSGVRPAFSAQNGFGNGSMLNNDDFMGNGMNGMNGNGMNGNGMPAFSENQFAGNGTNFGNQFGGNQFGDFNPFGPSDPMGNPAGNQNFDDSSFNALSGFAPFGQSFPSGQNGANFSLMPQNGQGQPPRQRWQNGSQQDQNR